MSSLSSIPKVDVVVFGGKKLNMRTGPGFKTNCFEIEMMDLQKVTMNDIDVTKEFMELKEKDTENSKKKFGINVKINNGMTPKINGIDISSLMMMFK